MYLRIVYDERKVDPNMILAGFVCTPMSDIQSVILCHFFFPFMPFQALTLCVSQSVFLCVFMESHVWMKMQPCEGGNLRLSNFLYFDFFPFFLNCLSRHRSGVSYFCD